MHKCPRVGLSLPALREERRSRPIRLESEGCLLGNSSDSPCSRAARPWGTEARPPPLHGGDRSCLTGNGPASLRPWGTRRFMDEHAGRYTLYPPPKRTGGAVQEPGRGPDSDPPPQGPLTNPSLRPTVRRPGRLCVKGLRGVGAPPLSWDGRLGGRSYPPLPHDCTPLWGWGS